MGDPVVRVAVVVGVALASLAVAWWARGRAARQAERRPFDVGGFSGRVLLFTSAECSSCDAARAALESAGVEFDEITYAEHPQGMRQAGVVSVPMIVVRDGSATVVGVIAGRPRPQRLRRLLGRAGL